MHRTACAASTQVYKYVGRVVGRFYDAAGGPTALLLGSEAAARAAARAAEAAEAAQGQQQAPADPACDVKWSQEDGEAVRGRERGGGRQLLLPTSTAH